MRSRVAGVEEAMESVGVRVFLLFRVWKLQCLWMRYVMIEQGRGAEGGVKKMSRETIGF